MKEFFDDSFNENILILFSIYYLFLRMEFGTTISSIVYIGLMIVRIMIFFS